MSAPRLLAGAVLFAVACGQHNHVAPPPGQILLYVDTDAPLPVVGGTAPIPPLFDRVRVEIYEPGASDPCADCSNTFALDTDMLRTVAASIGIAPRVGVAGYRARVRLFSTALTTSLGDPDPATAVDVTVLLPPALAEGKIAVTVPLHVDDVGVPVGSPSDPVAPVKGAPTSSAVGTWPGAQRVPCAGDPSADEACVPGGAFWLGTEDTLIDVLPMQDALGPRLVVLSPFFLKRTEVTVAEFRAAHGSATSWSGGNTGSNVLDFCTNTLARGPHEDEPVNCVSWSAARQYCRAQGRELPTEAQFEYAASGLAGHRYVWGDDRPECPDAMFGRAGYGVFTAVAPCKPPAPPGGVAPIGSGARDALALPTGTIVDLAGNVSEWAVDDWNRHDEACWSAQGVYRDPVCKGKSSSGLSHPVRGGEWLVNAGALVRTQRAGAPLTFITPEAGFRCARPGIP